MDIVGGCLVALLVYCGGAACMPRDAAGRGGVRGWFDRRVAARAAALAQARLTVDPRLYEGIALTAPVALALAGAAYSPPGAALGLAAGLLLPRWVTRRLTARQQNRSEAEASQLLQVLLATLGAGTTYFEALQAARRGITDQPLADDLADVIRRFLLDIPLEQALLEVRPRIAGRNLGLVWDNLAICVAQKIPAERARALLTDIAATVRYNVQLAGEVRAQTSGQRLQVWVLAVLVPGMYLYLRLVSPYFLEAVDGTWTGRFVILPAAAALEVLGIWLSFRLSRVRV